jgi:hypothetical protein
MTGYNVILRNVVVTLVIILSLSCGEKKSKVTDIVANNNTLYSNEQQILKLAQEGRKEYPQVSQFPPIINYAELNLSLINENTKLLKKVKEQEDQLRKQIEELKSRRSWIYGLMIALGAFSIPIAIGLLILEKPKLAFLAGGMGISSAVTGLVFQDYGQWISLGGAILLFGFIGYSIYLVFKNKGFSKKSLLEVVRSFNIVTELGWTQQTKNIIKSIQSLDTQNLIDKIKEEDRLQKVTPDA